jgi:hypothetical protein
MMTSRHRWAMRQQGPPRKRAVLPQPSRPTTICPEEDGTSPATPERRHVPGVVNT